MKERKKERKKERFIILSLCTFTSSYELYQSVIEGDGHSVTIYVIY